MNRLKDLLKNNFLIISLILVIALVLTVTCFLSRDVRRTVYSERQEMLTMVASTSANIVNQETRLGWNFFDFFYSSITQRMPQTNHIATYMKHLRDNYDLGRDFIFAVDEQGKYYASDGVFGKMTDLELYMPDTEPRLEYLGTLPHLTPDVNYIIYRGRMEHPVAVNTDKGQVYIKYLAYAHDLTAMQQSIGKLIPGECNLFLFDSDGFMLYKNFGIRLLLDGFNIYPKFEQCRRPYGEKADDLINACKNREPLSVRIDIGKENFYFCSAPVATADWSMAMIINETSLNQLSRGSFGNIILYITIIVVLLGFAIIMVVISSLRRRDSESQLVQTEKLAMALTEASRAKSDFLSNMSHDIRTPINGIMGMTAIALGAAENPRRMKDCLEKIDVASHHLLSLVNDVLDMSRIERGKTVIAAQPMNVRMVCDNCSSIIRGQLSDRDIDFVLDVRAEHAAVLSDELHLRQIFINILGNAVKFTPDGGRIWFRCREKSIDGDRVNYCFEIQDTGIGMSPEFQEHIFESFTQEEHSERTKYKGTGLGMAITKQLVELMGGSIEVESKVGEGSTFRVSLQFEIDPLGKQRTGKEQVSGNISGLSILLVEDNDLNQEIATELLQHAGARVEVASDGQEAVDKFSSQPAGTYDIILMDIMMPHMNGLDATRAIRALDRPDAATIPVVAMTANAFDEDVRATQEAGMNAHLSKPIDMEEVIRTVSFYCVR